MLKLHGDEIIIFRQNLAVFVEIFNQINKVEILLYNGWSGHRNNYGSWEVRYDRGGKVGTDAVWLIIVF